MGSRSPKTPLVEGPEKPGIPPTKEAAALQLRDRLRYAPEARRSRFPHHCGRSTSWDLGGSRLSDSGLARPGGIFYALLYYLGLGEGTKVLLLEARKVTLGSRNLCFSFPNPPLSAPPALGGTRLFIPKGTYFQLPYFPPTSLPLNGEL